MALIARAVERLALLSVRLVKGRAALKQMQGNDPYYLLMLKTGRNLVCSPENPTGSFAVG